MEEVSRDGGEVQKAPPSEFLNDLIGHAKLVQDLLEAMEIMLNKVQKNIHLLLEESREKILDTAKNAVKQFKQQKIKAEIQQILKGEKWSETDSDMTSEEGKTIFIEATTEQVERTTNTEMWLIIANTIPLIHHVALYWMGCYDQICQTH